MSLSHSKNWALNGWFLSQVSIQHTPMEIASPVGNSDRICRANSGGLDLTHPCSLFSKNDSSSTLTPVTCFLHHKIFQGGQDLNQKASPLSPPAPDEIDGSIQPGATTESISNGHPSITFVAQKAAAIFQMALVFSQGRSCEQTTLFCLWLCQVVLFFSISSCDQINRSINFFHSHFVSRPPDQSFLCFHLVTRSPNKLIFFTPIL
ncbi:uncharacterized protein LOC119161263 isoform X2 [Rhipicephalus microplus]